VNVWSCVEVAESMTAYMEGEIAAPERISFEEHVVICPPCRALMTQLRTTKAAARTVPEPPFSPELELQLLRAFRGWRAER
jgi:anti-sigma factor RsiW